MAVRFDERFLEELKSRLRPSDVIGRTVKLRKQGREYVGLSPFNKEKTPSFYVNDDKGQFFDFSSGKTGDLISFLQETEHLSFVEAVEKLASEVGLALPVMDREVAVMERERQGLSDWIDLAASWFEAQLRRPVGDEARAYLERRGLPSTEWANFKVGFAPNGRTALKDYLIAKGAHAAELIDAGLLIAPEDGSAAYDRFRNRIIFPITDVRGRIVSFGGRAMDPQARAKYLNGPETSLFHKGHTLYGVAGARKLLTGNKEGPNPLLVVEGYMDVIACQRTGLAAVAPMGTALTEEQMELLWRFHPQPTLCFDGDAAGRRAADRSIERSLPLLKAGRSFNFAFVSGGKDPDDVLREHGAAVLRAQLTKTIQFVERLYERERDAEPLATPEQRAGFKARLRQAAATITDKDLAEEYRGDLFQRFYEQFRRQTFSGPGNKFDFAASLRGLLDKNTLQILQDRIRQVNAAVALAAVDHPKWLQTHVEQFAERGFGDKRLNPLVQPLLDAIQEDDCDKSLVLLNVKNEGVKDLLDKTEKTARESGSFPFLDADEFSESAKNYWDACFNAIVQLSEIENELKERSESVRNGPPVRDHKRFVDHGAALRQRQLVLGMQLSNGELWGRAA
ncbi:DNA primase [Phenylobacterium sp. 20VBR1]|uniref:DNA primase n=1 Tax=Phenylobacterium glaciei TaxID=2803784 RepID=A0A941HXQ9_9CAUL|nr:DNA primase [Phenylobacterium glaciei]MBR7620670.1 DNA primase [Phenylobacterium glaciei]